MTATGAIWPLIALSLVVALIVALAWVARRLGLGGQFVTRAGKKRLAVVDVLALDGKRRLILVRRDGTEHLLLLGIHGDIVVETGITGALDAGSTAIASSFSATLESTTA